MMKWSFMQVGVLGMLLAFSAGHPLRGGEEERSGGPDAMEPLYIHDLWMSFYTWPITGILHGEAAMPPLPPVFLETPEGVRRVPLTRSRLTPPLRYRGMVPPVLFTLSPRAQTGGEPFIRVPVLNPEIPEDWKRATVILYPERRGGDGQWGHVLVSSLSLDVPEGHVRFVNSTDQSIAVEIHSSVRLIEPGAEVLFDPDTLTSRERFRLNIYAEDQRRKRTRMIYTGSHWRDEARGVLFLIHTRRGGRLNVLHFSPQRMLDAEAEMYTP